MRRIRDLGGQSEGDRPAVTVRVPAPLPAAPSAQEEAVLIAERLAALVESRRSGSSGAVRTTPADGGERRTPARSATESAGVVGARHSGRLLGNLLLTRGFIVESELRYALARQATTGGPIGQILVDLGLITDRDLVELLAEQLRMHVIDLARVECDRAAVSRLSKSDARRFAALPLRLGDGQMDVVIADPTDDRVVAELMAILGAPIRLFLATRADIDAAVDRYYD